jgi:glycosyltransferase involved in cell wall biosynthesis
MTVLWLCNVVIPKIAAEIPCDSDAGGGWLAGASDILAKHCNLIICFPLKKGKRTSGRAGRLGFYGFSQYKTIAAQMNNLTKLKLEFEEVICNIKPDIIHIWGTEYPHSCAMVKACVDAGRLDRAIISIQGMVSIIARHYFSGLPASAICGFTLRDILKWDSIYLQKKKFVSRGLLEKESIRKVKHVIGRTDWDEACVTRINPNVRYHFCNEILRKSFYENVWGLEKCARYSVFVSQGNYPIKGLHFVIEAMPSILEKFPDAHLWVAGQNIVKYDTPYDKIKISAYGLYIRKLIRKYGLWSHVTFTGVLDEQGMCDRYLKSHVFVSASSIENSPNSLGEAMLLGVPAVASDVGGVKNMMKHGEDGFVYQADAPYMLAFYVCRIFSDDPLANRISGNARRHAALTHDKDRNLDRLLKIYDEVIRCPEV